MARPQAPRTRKGACTLQGRLRPLARRPPRFTLSKRGSKQANPGATRRGNNGACPLKGLCVSVSCALITGAARGIGLATAKRFLADGYRVALLDIDGDTLAKSVAALNEPE